MAKIITRYFDSAETANKTRRELLATHRFPPRIIDMYGKDDIDGMLDAAPVDKATVAEYKKRLGKGGAVMMVSAGHQPLGVARIAREVTAKMGAADMGGLVEEVYFKEKAKISADKILADHPKFLSWDRDPNSTDHFMANWPIPHLSSRKPSDAFAIPRHGRMANWPIGLLAPKNLRYGKFPWDLIIKRRWHLFPGLLVPGHKYQAKFPFAHIVPGHKHMASFPIGHLVPGHRFMAKFPFGHLVPGHARMANWPFPLLFGGKEHTNSLVPGHKFMAKFPIAHLVPGHKFMAKFPIAHLVPGHRFMAKIPGHLIPGHKFMANFPFGHIVPGHKYMAKFPFAHIVPGHKYMANFIYPHTKTG